MNIEPNKSLRDYNSFGFDISAEFFIDVTTVEQLHEAMRWSVAQGVDVLVLGGGSNIVFTRDVPGLVIRIAIEEFTTRTDERFAYVKAGAGEVWHSLVAKTLAHGFYGLENLALIPGSAGAAPIQNIGAYGVEVEKLLDSVEVYDRSTGQLSTLPASDCQFAYRHSLFKTDAGKELIVTAINLKLSLQDKPTLTYRALVDALAAKGVQNPTAQQVFDEVCIIRQSKLPDPRELGNVGSFFKNPLLNRQQLDTLVKAHPDIPHFDDGGGLYKVPAAWLIDRAGWKGHVTGAVGVHSAQALVLVNHGGGNGQQIAVLANNIKEDILRRYGVSLEREPTLF